ncbi:MAG: porin family protein [Epsilonproteobacteria bacterium]|nr:porin family protein [Campylobacterota bacterium]
MKKALIVLSSTILLSSTALAGGKVVSEVVTPVVPVVSKHDTSGLYISGAMYYNNVYATKYSWFNNTQDTQDEIGGLTAIVGYNYNEYLAFEARASKSFFAEDYADEYHFSFFVKPQYRFRDEDSYEENYFTIYALLGFGYVNVELTDGDTPGASESIGNTLVDNWEFQYGIGLSYTFVDTDHPEDDSGDWSIFVEYTMYMDDESMSPTRLYDYNPNTYDTLSMNGLSVGISYQF